MPLRKNDKTIYEFTRKVKDTLSFMPYAEIIFISAETGQRLNKLFETIDMVRENQTMRCGNGCPERGSSPRQPPSSNHRLIKAKRLKIYYTTQVAVKPPTFVNFVNDKELMHFSYVRYLENRIREALVSVVRPWKFITRERSGKDAE